jgi:hypothetical protein
MAGSGGGGTTTTTQNLSPEQKRLLGFVMPVAEGYFDGSGGVNAASYPGPRIAGQDPLESLGGMMALESAFGNVGQASNSALGGLGFLASGDVLDVNRNPNLAGAINAAVRPLTEAFTEQTLPEIRSSGVLTGGYGSNRTEINTRLAARDYERQVADTSAAMANQAYQSGLDAMGKALYAAPSVLQSGLLPATTVAGVGAQQRGFEQAGIDASLAKFYEDQFLPLMIAQEIAGLAFGVPAGSTTSMAQGGGNALGSALGGAASGASLGSMIMPGWGTAIGGLLGALGGAFA